MSNRLETRCYQRNRHGFAQVATGGCRKPLETCFDTQPEARARRCSRTRLCRRCRERRRDPHHGQRSLARVATDDRADDGAAAGEQAPLTVADPYVDELVTVAVLITVILSVVFADVITVIVTVLVTDVEFVVAADELWWAGDDHAGRYV